MLQYALPILFTLFVWWFSTGIILYLDGLPRWTFRWSMALASVALLWTLAVAVDTSQQTSVAASYKAFACGILSWGWVEMSFLMGFITGPRRTACPPESRAWRRAGYAIEAILYHEFALIGIALALVGSTWNAPNRLSLETFLVLWVLRLSAKLNVFLGVRNLGEEFLPEHLRYLQTYFTRKRMNFLFPISVTAASIAAVMFWRAGFSDDADAYQSTRMSFLATLLSLAVLEHWLLVLPIPPVALWNWGLGPRHGVKPAASS